MTVERVRGTGTPTPVVVSRRPQTFGATGTYLSRISRQYQRIARNRAAWEPYRT